MEYGESEAGIGVLGRNWTLAGGAWFVRDLLRFPVVGIDNGVENDEYKQVSAVLYRLEGPAPENYTMGACATLDEGSQIGTVRLRFGERDFGNGGIVICIEKRLGLSCL